MLYGIKRLLTFFGKVNIIVIGELGIGACDLSRHKSFPDKRLDDHDFFARKEESTLSFTSKLFKGFFIELEGFEYISFFLGHFWQPHLLSEKAALSMMEGR